MGGDRLIKPRYPSSGHHQRPRTVIDYQSACRPANQPSTRIFFSPISIAFHKCDPLRPISSPTPTPHHPPPPHSIPSDRNRFLMATEPIKKRSPFGLSPSTRPLNAVDHRLRIGGVGRGVEIARLFFFCGQSFGVLVEWQRRSKLVRFRQKIDDNGR